MSDQQPRLVAKHHFSASDVGVLEDRLDKFNRDRTGCLDSELLGFELSLEGELVGAVAGFTWAGFCELRQLWVDEKFRKAGHGTALLNAAINEARARQCAQIYLATYSFQAPEFYRKFGFKTVAVIENRPPGHSDFIMRLTL
jgi:N-acetylglutamate synthase-like GNAT family acetyltransferase